MGPRLGGRGDSTRRACCRRRSTRFNGAAARWPRRLDDYAREVIDYWLQWGRGSVAAETGHLMFGMCHISIGASMGPRLGGRGDTPTHWLALS